MAPSIVTRADCMLDDSRNIFGSLSRFCPGEVLGEFLQTISPVTQFSTLCGRIFVHLHFGDTSQK
jgi:hypothetical protein